MTNRVMRLRSVPSKRDKPRQGVFVASDRAEPSKDFARKTRSPSVSGIAGFKADAYERKKAIP